MTKLNNEIRELATDELNGVSGGARSDLGQQLQLALQEANNIYTQGLQGAVRHEREVVPDPRRHRPEF